MALWRHKLRESICRWPSSPVKRCKLLRPTAAAAATTAAAATVAATGFEPAAQFACVLALAQAKDADADADTDTNADTDTDTDADGGFILEFDLQFASQLHLRFTNFQSILTVQPNQRGGGGQECCMPQVAACGGPSLSPVRAHANVKRFSP